MRDGSLREAERLVGECAEWLALPDSKREWKALGKGDRRKVMLAILLRKRTTAGNEWIAERLSMGAAGSVSRLTESGKE